MAKVSIITPVYVDDADKIEWLVQMLESVQEQTFQDWEVILIDDVSPMLLGAIKMRFQDEPRFRWLKASRNQGPAMCRNTAVNLAESDCILPVDADDQLANPDTLQRMYDAWKEDKTKIVYGNLQRLVNQGGSWQRGNIIQFPDYTFERVMDLNGLIPVTAMHSINCHKAAGGWKTALQFGLEDVEYWIAAGKAGYCGHRINNTSLIYRRHDKSRSYALRHINRNEDLMKRQIMDSHIDVFNGNFPMGCCGKGNNNSTSQAVSMQSMNVPGARVTTLDGYPDEQLVWVEYAGKRAASFGISGRTTRTDYRIMGIGHKMQVHRDDLHIFRSLGRGQDFRIGIPAPAPEQAPAPAREQTPAPEFNSGLPELAEIERLDPVAAQARGIPIDPPQEVRVVETTPPRIEDMHPSLALPASNGATDLSVLNLSENLMQMLTLENWTVEKVAEAETNDLTPYSGIGEKRAAQIITTAKQWLDQTH